MLSTEQLLETYREQFERDVVPAIFGGNPPHWTTSRETDATAYPGLPYIERTTEAAWAGFCEGLKLAWRNR